MKKSLVAAFAALVVFAATPTAFAYTAHASYNHANVGGGSAVSGGQDNSVATGPSSSISGGLAGSNQYSSVNNYADAGAGGGNSYGNSGASGNAGGVSGAISGGNASTSASGGSDYSAQQHFRAGSSNAHSSGHGHP